MQPVGEQVVLDLPLAEDAHDLDLALGAAHEELLVVDGEGHVAVGVEVRLEPEVDEHVEHPAAQRVLVAGRGEVGQRRGIGHGSNANHSLGSPPCLARPPRPRSRGPRP